MLKIILVMVIKMPQISIHWVFVQEKIRYPKQNSSGEEFRSQYSLAPELRQNIV